MTIALGILGGDGLVIAADTQEGVQGYWKNTQGKIKWGAYVESGAGKGACIVSGATSNAVVHLDELSGLLLKDFSLDRPSESLETTMPKLQDRLRTFYIDHVAIVPQNPPEYELIVGAAKNGRNGLWTTSKSVMTRHETFAAVGIGAGHATHLLNRCWDWRELDVIGTAILAAYVVFHVKGYVDGCGMYTDVCMIRDDRCFLLRRKQVSCLEDTFRRLSEETDKQISNYLFGSQHGDPRPVAKALKAARAEFMRVAQGKEHGHWWLDVGETVED